MSDNKFILHFSRAPGDVLMMTSLVRDLKLTYGDRYHVDVRAPFPDLWRHNPYITPIAPGERNAKTINFTKGAAADSVALRKSKLGGGNHYCTAFQRAFTDRTGIKVEPLLPRADLHLTDEEKKTPNISGRYWIIIPGGKTDMTTKWWLHHRYQEVVDRLRPWGLRFVQEGANKPGHVHPPLNGVLGLVSKTSIRDLIRNIYHAEGVICGVTLPMHIAGALEKPCVVLMGGREEPSFEHYSNDYPGSFGPKSAPVRVPHRMLHTIGLLECCRSRGCWMTHVEPDSSRQHAKIKLCKVPDKSDPRQTAAMCQSLISTDHVCEAIMAYYEDGTLSPP